MRGKSKAAGKGMRWKTFHYLKHGKPFSYRRRVPVKAKGKPTKNGGVEYKTYSYISGKTGKKVNYRRRIHPAGAKRKKSSTRTTSSGKELSKQDIREAIRLINKASHMLKPIKCLVGGNLIHKIRFSGKIAESMALHLLRDGKIIKKLKKCKFSFGGGADIMAVFKGHEFKIEVKGSQDKPFQNLTRKDVEADYLIWIVFGDLLKKSIRSNFKLYWLTQNTKLKKQLNKQRRGQALIINSLRELEQIVGSNAVHREKFKLSEL